MAKFYGVIGFSTTSETSPGVWTTGITERTYSGDVVKESRKWQTGEGLNDNLNVANQLSVLVDPYAFSNIHNMKYVEWLGAKWKITKVDIRRPRVLLAIGGVYNGD